jgi:hypothetical protein
LTIGKSSIKRGDSKLGLGKGVKFEIEIEEIKNA